ncbi:MAG: four-helix bundle copper-binding protein [Bacillota bacterium]|nr:four-helix bundle copper-binding protein [Bacillota bacterium]
MQATVNVPTVSLLSGGNPHQSCIDACMKCVQICQECITLCLNEADVKSRINCIKTLQDCAEICSTTACYISRGSGSIKNISALCASICEKCATECSVFQDQHCKACADVCHSCASECRKM